MVTEGLIYHDTQWKLTTDDPIVIGVSELIFEQNSAFAFGNVYANSTAVLATSVGDVLTLSAGNNISISGNNTSKTVTIGVTGISLNSISNGTSNVNVVSSGGNVTVGIAGTSNVAVFNSAGANITGTLGVSGNITGGNLTTDGLVLATGNIIGGNLNTSGIVSATGNINTSSALNINSTAGNYNVLNISGAALGPYGSPQTWKFFTNNTALGGSPSFIVFPDSSTQTTAYPGTTSALSLTANITGGNLISNAAVIATGNITGGNILGNGAGLTGINTFKTVAITGGNSAVAANIADTLTLEAGSGIVLIANSVSRTITFSTGGTGESIFATGGDMELITDLVTDSLDLGLVTELVTENNDLGGFYIEGFVSNDNFLPGTIYGNILLANAVISTTGNITGGNITTAGLVSATGNITGGNLVTAGQVVATGAVYSNFNTNTANTASFNATGGNTKGGTGYLDFLVARNTSGGATNPYKWLRLNSTGGLEIINSAYSATLLTLTDAGAFSVASTVSATGFNVNNRQAVNGPAFSAYASSGTTIPTDVLTKVNFQTEEYDTNSNFASSRFTPTVEGYYQLNSTVRISGSSGTGEMMIVLYKNGAEYHRGWNSQGVQIGSGWWSMSVSSTAYATGTGDYFEIYVQQGSAANRDTTSGTTITWFNGCMLRGA
jgi:hypothetical protein